MSEHHKMYLAGEWVDSAEEIRVESPFDNSPVGTVAAASQDDFTGAIDSAVTAFELTRELPAYKREAACRQIAEELEKNAESFARMMALELGKAIKDARAEVMRAIGVFRVSAEEAKRVGGEIIDLDWGAGSEGRIGLLRRFPRGVIGGITPFNFPLNLVAHKIGPAMASGNCMVLKPASKTPIVALMLAQLIDHTDYPKGAISILPGSGKAAAPLLLDERVKLITFTGSAEVGWWIKAQAGKKPVVLELGGNAGVAVADDADLEFASTRLMFGAYAVAGQSCISVQRIYIHESIYERFTGMLVEKISRLKTGNPLEPTTDIGPLVDDLSADRTKQFIEEALTGGAKLLCGGTITGRMCEPTLLADVSRTMALHCREAFAPVAIVDRYRDFHEVVDKINDSEFGLQAGIFTNRMNDIVYAFKRIETGGVIINDVPTYRVDQMPYGGVKSSGLGREGVRYAIEDMTEPKLLAINPR
ncbi:aldehyde dehydrogenase [candidate division GN15 bacterium]|uniref:Aldehyde dehydrogenase n=1 Tax=candidate division GN15 bacterium TaxID=2072418 RepID=A0A855X898_9BACT|nr:MAG: aldehyde dehydrogenase [candidate division GN15 bacterium]